MSFLSGIAGAVASVFHFVTGTGGQIVSGISGVVGNIANTVSNVASSVSSFLHSDIAHGLSAVFGTINPILNGIRGFVNDVRDTVSAIVDPIHSFINNVTGIVQTINDGVIQPVREAISGISTLVTQVPQEIEAGISHGLSGFLQLPQELSNTLAGVDAQFSRAVQQLGSHNETIASNILAPAIGNAAFQPIGELGNQLGAVLNPEIKSVGVFPTIHISEADILTHYEKQIKDVFDQLQSQNGIWRFLGNMVASILDTGPFILEDLVPRLESFKQQLNKQDPVAMLGMGDYLNGYFRKILSEENFREQLARKGLSESNIALLVGINSWIPGVSEALNMFYKNVITGDALDKTLTDHGLRSDTIEAVRLAYLERVNPREAIVTEARRAAASRGFLSQSLTEQAPNEMLQRYAPRHLEPDIAHYDWTNHWRVPDIRWWITAYFRGMRTRSEVEQAAQAHMIPPEVVGDLIDVEADVVQLWMIPDMIAAGIFTDQEALDYLHYIGLGQRDSEVILKYGNSKQKAPAAAQAADLSKISAAQAKTMFDDGIINEQIYVEILLDHKYTQEAAQLTVSLAKQEQAIAARKTELTTLIDEVDVGAQTEQNALSYLYANGYTDAEVAKFVKDVHTKQVAKAKLPSRSELESFVKKGIIPVSVWRQAMTSIGYAKIWQDAFLADYGLDPNA